MVVAYISTSFALKIQYVILGLIILSLGSIFLGSSEGLKVGVDRISSPNFSVLFGIFFPAVTGFTAGVAMSGDLKNPRISIPWGTMLSIVIGLVVYITLAFFIYYNIDAEILRTNNNVLIQFGAIPILVLGGVWGATLSSALGGILGGPRILQAMSIDHITPKIFSKGHGVNNEPRNALILTFIIAELGILIGELNVIAELVAMFYMAAYLFINISCFLEQWSSPDFRPKFKIPIAISLVGAVATFLLMIQLNLAATLVAVIVMMAFWFWLSKKDLVLGTGDVWFSVWTSIVKTALKNLQKKSVHKRNWQPNILLFSGGTQNRPHLIEFGKSIMGRGGMVSNFDLIEVDSASTLFPKSHQIVKDGEGATKFVEVNVSGAKNYTIAKRFAFSVANSPLVKTAIFGEDANWGRLVMALGKCGQELNAKKITISIGGVEVAKNGTAVFNYNEGAVSKHMKGQNIIIEISIGEQAGSATVWTCDLTSGYIAINADYRT